MTPRLFEPLSLRDITVRNRIWVPPMCQYSCDARDGVATSWHMAHLGALARGGAGAVIAEATAVSPEGRISPEDLGLWNAQQQEALAPVAAFMRSQGAVPGIQLAHAGRKASTYRPFAHDSQGDPLEGSVPQERGGWVTYGPSAVAYPGLATPEALSQAQIARVVSDFADAAARAVAAGFELIEIHAAHGYLLHEFLSPLSNHRTDSYGGSLHNRGRVLREVMEAVRERVGERVLVAVRVSATDWHAEGLTVPETIQVLKSLAPWGVDVVDVSSGGNYPATIDVGPGYQVPVASEVREGTSLPVAAVGLITSGSQAEDILVSGQADVVLMGREALRDPHVALRAAAELGHRAQEVPQQYQRAW